MYSTGNKKCTVQEQKKNLAFLSGCHVKKTKILVESFWSLISYKHSFK